MSLSIKLTTRLSTLGNSMIVLDKTGAYDVDNNEGGWGDPNPELNQSALSVYAKRVAQGTFQKINGVTVEELYNPNASNTDETAFELTLAADGHYDVYLFQLEVSNDGLTTVAGPLLVTGQYFYWDLNDENPSRIYQFLDSDTAPRWVEEKEELVDIISVPQGFCQIIYHPDLTVKKNDYYKEFAFQRDNGCDDLTPYRNKLVDLDQDLKGVNSAFYSGLPTEAERQIDNLLEKHGIV